MNTVLGLDPGTYTGWAIARGGYDKDKLWYTTRIVESGTRSFQHAADQSFGMMFIAFRKFLTELQREHGPFAAIAYELPFSGYGAAITGRITTGMGAHILERCATWRCRPLPVNVNTLKKFATGDGRADKALMIRAARDCLKAVPPPTLTEHEADAIHIARWGAAHMQQGGENDGKG